MTTKTKKGPEVRNDHNLHPAIYKALCRDDYDYAKSGDISATALLKPPRASVLSKRYSHLTSIDCTDRTFLVSGSAFHTIIEREAESLGYAIVEERIGTKMKGPKGEWLVTCKPDMLTVKDDICQVYDWKETGTFGYVIGTKEGVEGLKKDWVEQLNINSFIIYEALGWPTEKLQIGVRFRDWKKAEFEKSIHNDDTSYPAAQMLMVDIPLWSHKEQKAFIMDRLAVHQEARECEDNALPLCSADERWERGEKWAVMKGANKRATKLFNDPAEAEAMVGTLPGARVEHRPGRAIRCESYCDGAAWCDFYQQAFNKPVPKDGEIIKR